MMLQLLRLLQPLHTIFYSAGLHSAESDVEVMMQGQKQERGTSPPLVGGVLT